MGMKWYLIVHLVCISLKISYDVQSFHGSFVCILWRNACSCPLPICNWVVWVFLLLLRCFYFEFYNGEG
jgi:hypothetical protein